MREIRQTERGRAASYSCTMQTDHPRQTVCLCVCAGGRAVMCPVHAQAHSSAPL